MDRFVALMRRYVEDYTNRHDTSVCAEIMEPDYALRMGPHLVAGRDEQYIPAARTQFAQFPDLRLTVHEIVTSGDRLAMAFTEHGRSVRHGDRAAAWTGLGLYRWNGRKLVENWVEQDYLARRRQLATGVSAAVGPAAPAPWDTVAQHPDPAAEAVVRRWIADGLGTADRFADGSGTAAGLADGPGMADGRADGPGIAAGLADGSDSAVTVDDGDPRPLLDAAVSDVDDLFSAGRHVAFRLTRRGRYAGGLGPDAGIDDAALVGAEATLHLVGLVTVDGGRVTGGRIVRDRLGLARSLAAAAEGRTA